MTVTTERMKELYPEAIDIGSDILIMWFTSGDGFLWYHPECKSWLNLWFEPCHRSTGHKLTSGGPTDIKHLTINGSLICPLGCGRHGSVRNGRWVKA